MSKNAKHCCLFTWDTSSLQTGVDEPASAKVEALILLSTANPIYTCSFCLENELVLHQYLLEKTKGLKRLGHITTWISAEWRSNNPFVTADCALTHPVSHKTRNCWNCCTQREELPKAKAFLFKSDEVSFNCRVWVNQVVKEAWRQWNSYYSSQTIFTSMLDVISLTKASRINLNFEKVNFCQTLLYDLMLTN